ncbi:MAG: hypothetical protein K6F00_06230 [Lachnospiraceae bacterium]|nr:hypothetical protein [Lachnospiraceae bacterium]
MSDNSTIMMDNIKKQAEKTESIFIHEEKIQSDETKSDLSYINIDEVNETKLAKKNHEISMLMPEKLTENILVANNNEIKLTNEDVKQVLSKIKDYDNAFSSIMDIDKEDVLKNLTGHKNLKEQCDLIMKDKNVELTDEQKETINRYTSIIDYCIDYNEIVSSPMYVVLQKKGMYLGGRNNLSPVMDHALLEVCQSGYEKGSGGEELLKKWDKLQKKWQKMLCRDLSIDSAQKLYQKLFGMDQDIYDIKQDNVDDSLINYNKHKFYVSVAGGWMYERLKADLPQNDDRTMIGQRMAKALLANLSLYKSMSGEETYKGMSGEETIEKYKYLVYETKGLNPEELQEKIDVTEDLMKEVSKWNLDDFSLNKNGKFDEDSVEDNFLEKYSKMQILTEMDYNFKEYEKIFFSYDTNVKKIKTKLSKDEVLKFYTIKQTLQTVFPVYNAIFLKKQLPASNTEWGKELLRKKTADITKVEVDKNADAKTQMDQRALIKHALHIRLESQEYDEFRKSGDCKAFYNKHADDLREQKEKEWTEKYNYRRDKGMYRSLRIDEKQEAALEYEKDVMDYMAERFKGDENLPKRKIYTRMINDLEIKMKLLYNDVRDKNEDSSLMKKIKSSLEKVSECLTGEATEKNFRGFNAYRNQAIELMIEYENSKNPFTSEGKRRKKRVVELRHALEEIKTFNNTNKISEDSKGKWTVKDTISQNIPLKKEINEGSYEVHGELLELENDYEQQKYRLDFEVDKKYALKKEELPEILKSFDGFRLELRRKITLSGGESSYAISNAMESFVKTQKKLLSDIGVYKEQMKDKVFSDPKEAYMDEKIQKIINFVDKYYFIKDMGSKGQNMLISYFVKNYSNKKSYTLEKALYDLVAEKGYQENPGAFLKLYQ